jgi:aminopeptidase-like protein
MITQYYNLAKNILFPICRSITGNGTKKTLKIIQMQFPKLSIKNILSGTKVFDWRVPPEWNIYDAYVLDKNNNKIIDFGKNNLHIVGYSSPVNKLVSKKELLRHIYSLPEQPKAIPYITSYYKKLWGFCISEEYKKLIINKYHKGEKFRVVIKSNFNRKGSLTYGELIIKGESEQELLISTYICHPSMANNELSGPILSMSLINHFQKKIPKKTLRFVFVPETIGSICYLHKNLEKLKKKIIGGYNLTCIGDERAFSVTFSKYGNALSDISAVDALNKLKIKFKRYSFLDRGSDERQYNSPGVNLKIVSLSRSKHGYYPEYHTSLDNFNIVTIKGIKKSFNVVKKIIKNFSNRIVPVNKYLCEPQMSKRRLYPTLMNTKIKNYNKNRVLMDFLQYSDGNNDLQKISEILNISIQQAKKIFFLLKKKKLILS